MTARAVLIPITVAACFAATTAASALLTHGHAEASLSLSDVLVPAAVPVLAVIGITLACRHYRSRNHDIESVSPSRPAN